MGLDVYALGNALVDVQVKVEDSFLAEFGKKRIVDLHLDIHQCIAKSIYVKLHFAKLLSALRSEIQLL